eukprot:gene7942-1156_t
MARPKIRPKTLRQVWREALPHQRRNVWLSGIVMGWAAALYVDMSYLKQDPVMREKFGLDDTGPEREPPPNPVYVFWDKYTKWLKPKDAEDY